MKYCIRISHLLMSIFSGCITEPNTNFKATLKNDSGSKILLTPYLKGSPALDKEVYIFVNESLEIANGSDRGKVNHAGFDSQYLTGMDSLVVIFNDSFKITHYRINPETPSANHYLNEDFRNLFNYLNYEYSIDDRSRGKRVAYYNYVFTEQDYLDAKN